MANAPRYTQAPTRDILVLLSKEPGGTLLFVELIDHLRETFEPNEHDAAPPRYSRAEAAWVDYLLDGRTAFVRVGWVIGTPDEWTITDRGRDALLTYPTPEQIRIAARDGARVSKPGTVAQPARPTTSAVPTDAGPEAATDEQYDDAHVEAIRKLVILMEAFVDDTDLKPLADYPLREAIYFWWRRREFKRSGQLYASKYPMSVPWSPAAAARARTGPRCGGLIIEHVVPNNVTRQRLRETVNDPAEFRRVLDSEVFFVVTKEEDDLINAAGYMSSIPDSGDPLDRYRLAGINPSGFAPLDLD